MQSIKTSELNTLINYAQKNDIKALEELIRRIQRDVFCMFSYLTDNRQDISDLTQEALLKIAKNIHNLKDTCCFKSWLNHIITNTYYDYSRKRLKENNVDLDEDKILEIRDKIGCEPGEKCLFSEMDKLIKAAMLSLPMHLRIVIVLREYEGLSYEDISKVTNTTVGTVKSRISRARAKLQTQLKEFM
ncbi:sigma-70 family RNA polymerase sigma factor [bacterium]|nr:sigma-70 family RNA polymerase sigma factor [bacterium]